MNMNKNYGSEYHLFRYRREQPDRLDAAITEEGFRLQLRGMGFSSDEVDYQLERARGLHMLAR